MSFPLLSFVVLPVTTGGLVPVQQPTDGGGQGADFGKSSPVGLLVLLLFLIAVAFLIRSMTKHLKRVPASFDEDTEPDAPADAPAEADAEKPADKS